MDLFRIRKWGDQSISARFDGFWIDDLMTENPNISNQNDGYIESSQMHQNSLEDPDDFDFRTPHEAEFSLKQYFTQSTIKKKTAEDILSILQYLVVNFIKWEHFSEIWDEGIESNLLSIFQLLKRFSSKSASILPKAQNPGLCCYPSFLESWIQLLQENSMSASSPLNVCQKILSKDCLDFEESGMPPFSQVPLTFQPLHRSLVWKVFAEWIHSPSIYALQPIILQLLISRLGFLSQLLKPLYPLVLSMNKSSADNGKKSTETTAQVTHLLIMVRNKNIATIHLLTPFRLFQLSNFLLNSTQQTSQKIFNILRKSGWKVVSYQT